MKNKKKMLVFLFVFYGLSFCYGQEPDKIREPSKVYVKIYGGYGLLSPGSFTGPESLTFLTVPTPTGGVRDSVAFKVQDKGLGSGFRFGGGLGIILSHFLNVGVDVDYLSGRKIKTQNNFISSNATSKSNRTISHSLLTVAPHVTFKALTRPNYLFYNRIGINLSVSRSIKYDGTTFGEGKNGSLTRFDTAFSSGEYNTDFGLGAQVGVGAQFRLSEKSYFFSEKLRFFSEIVLNMLVIKPVNNKETVVLRSKEGILRSTTTTTTTTTYQKEGPGSTGRTYQTRSGGPTNFQIEAVQPASPMNINSIGLNLGVVYRF